MIHARDFQQALGLECLVSSSYDTWDILSPELNRPGIQFTGYMEYFAYGRPQVIGKVEMAYLESLEDEDRYAQLKRFFSYPIPCMVICRGMQPLKEMMELHRGKCVEIYDVDLFLVDEDYEPLIEGIIEDYPAKAAVEARRRFPG